MRLGSVSGSAQTDLHFESFPADLGRMYNLVSRITDGLGELKKLLETHIYNQGLAAIEKCGEAALNVSVKTHERVISWVKHASFDHMHVFFLPFIQDPKMYVQTILDVHKKYNALVMSAFNNDAGFVAALDKVTLLLKIFGGKKMLSFNNP